MSEKLKELLKGKIIDLNMDWDNIKIQEHLTVVNDISNLFELFIELRRLRDE